MACESVNITANLTLPLDEFIRVLATVKEITVNKDLGQARRRRRAAKKAKARQGGSRRVMMRDTPRSPDYPSNEVVFRPATLPRGRVSPLTIRINGSGESDQDNVENREPGVVCNQSEREEEDIIDVEAVSPETGRVLMMS